MPKAGIRRVQRLYNGCTTVVRGMPKAPTRSNPRSNAEAMPEQPPSNTLVPPATQLSSPPSPPLICLCVCREIGLNCATMFLKPLRTLSCCCAAATLAVTFSSRAANPIPADCKTSRFFIGCQAYTFNRFSVFEAIEKTAQAGGKVIEFYPGQKLSKEEPAVKWDHNASPETIQKVKDK